MSVRSTLIYEYILANLVVHKDVLAVFSSDHVL